MTGPVPRPALTLALAALVCGGLASGGLVCADENPPPAARRVDMSFEGQMHGAVQELKEKMAADPDLRGRKLKLGKFTASDLPDSRFEQQFERTFRQVAADLLDEQSPMTVSGRYDYVPGGPQNAGLQVVQMTLEIKNAQRRPLQTVIREINNSGDIAQIVGIAVAIPDTSDVARRNQAVLAAHVEPAFARPGETRVGAAGDPLHAVELRVRRGGDGPPTPVRPRDVGGRAFVDIAVGDTFEIALLNADEAADAVAVVTIDGLDVAEEFCEDPKTPGKKVYDGYVAPRGGKAVVVSGWLRTARREPGNVLSFVVNEYGKGAATARRSRGTRGVINVLFFEAVPEGERLPARAVGGEVGVGKPIDVDLETRKMTRQPVPIANVTLHYSEAAPPATP